MTKHKNLSIFVPHTGCKNQCSFCDQRAISNTQSPPTPKEVYDICCEFLPLENGADYEIAFFGGSFTAIDSEYMLQLLQTAFIFVEGGRAAGIRISTRPDAIDEDILNILKKYGVTAIELGAQSMDDDVLIKNGRGHSRADVINAAALIKKAGISLGLQMMIGMYGQENYHTAALATAESFCQLKPDTVRVYPTITLKNTQLSKLYKSGKYIPLELSQAVDISAQLIDIFEDNDIKIIKMGLHSDTVMQDSIVAGPYHPAFRELAISKGFFEKVKRALTIEGVKECIINVNPKQLSQFKGQKNQNILRFADIGIKASIKPQEDILKNKFIIKKINSED